MGSKIINIFIILILSCLFFCSSSLLFLSNIYNQTQWAKIMDINYLSKNLCEISIRYNIEGYSFDNKIITRTNRQFKPNDFILIEYNQNNYQNVGYHSNINFYSMILFLSGLIGILICTILYDQIYINILDKLDNFTGIFDLISKTNI